MTDEETPARPPRPAKAAAEDRAPADEGRDPRAEESAPGAPETAAARDPRVTALRRALDDGTAVVGKVIGWNRGGFHVVVDALTAFCPRSEMATGKPGSPKQYLDRSFPFLVLRIRRSGREIVLSRKQLLEQEAKAREEHALADLQPGQDVEGRVSSIVDFGAFVDLGGAEGLVHVSELSRRHVSHPAEVIRVGQEVTTRILSIDREKGRISLSLKALEPDPWNDVAERYTVGTVVRGVVERVAKPGAFIELEPGVKALLPTALMAVPPDSSPARAYPPGRRVELQVHSIEPRRRRITLAPRGSQSEGTQADLREYQRRQRGEGSGFTALAAAFEQLDDGSSR